MAEKGYLEQDVIEFFEKKSESSLKTNILLHARNFGNLHKYLVKLKEFLESLYASIDPESLIQEILSRLQQNKTAVAVSSLVSVGGSETYESQGNTYRVSRISEKQVVIENMSNTAWDVSKLGCFVKTVNGIMLYPAIQTADNTITITFNSNVSQNYLVYIF